MARMVAKALVVLPVHNEATRAGMVAAEIKRFRRKYSNSSFWVVDDGSGDGTVAAFRKALRGVPQAEVMGLPQNGGKGRAIRLAFARAKHDYLIFMDGDMAYSLKHLSPMMTALKKSHVVIGSRSMAPQPRGGLPARRVFLGWGFNRLACFILGLDYSDTQAGLKGFQKSAARELFSRLKLDGYAFDAELLYLAKKLNLKVAQIPAVVSATHTYKTSQVKWMKDSLRCLVDLCLIRWWSWKGAYNLP